MPRRKRAATAGEIEAARRVRLRRAELDLTLEEVAARTRSDKRPDGVHFQTIENLELGRSIPRAGNLLAIETALELPPGEVQRIIDMVDQIHRLEPGRAAEIIRDLRNA